MNAKFSASLASIALAASLILSCSDNGDDSNPNAGAVTVTEKHKIKSITSDSFEIEYEREYYECMEDGTLKKEVYNQSDDAAYLISNGVLSFKFNLSDKWIDFNGTSDGIIGAWTRKKDKKTYCLIGEYGYECSEGYDITKAVFTTDVVNATNAVEFTRDVCESDKEEDGRINEAGFKITVVDCDNYNFSKGKDVVKINYSKATITYKGKSCKMPEESSYSDMQKACRDAYTKASAEGDDSEGIDEYYWYFLYEVNYNNFRECLNNLSLPPDFFGNDEEEEDPDMLEKAKILLKKSKNSAFRK